MPDATTTPESRSSIVAPILAAGFITAAAMWFVGFVTHLPGIEFSGAVVAVPLFVVQFAMLTLAARLVSRDRAAMIGAGAGVVTGLINLLVLGSVLAGGESERATSFQDNAGLIAVGSVLFSGALGLIAGVVGSLIGKDCPNRTLDVNRWHFRFALAAPIAALPTLLSGGIVTSTETGLAVPDWPTSFGDNMFLFSLSKMTGGIYYEHAHRLFGSLVGLTVLTLMVYTLLRKGAPGKAKLMAGIAFIAVCLQGVIGGIRVEAAVPTDDPDVTTDHAGSIAYAMFHGVSGQITFALLLVLASMLSLKWMTAPKTEKTDNKLRTFSVVFLVLLVIQLIVGVGLRHTDLSNAFLHPHILLALFVLIASAMAGFRAIATFKDNDTIRKCGHACVHSTGLQFILGIAALVVLLLGKDDETNSASEVILATAHQANGALVLGAGTLLFLWVRRLVPKA